MSTGPASRSASLPRFGRGAAVGLFLLFLLLGVVFTAPLVRHLRDALPYAAVPPPGRELVYGVQGDYLQFYYYLWLVEERLLQGPPSWGPLPVRDRRAPGEPPEHLPAGRAPLRPALRPRPSVRLQRPRPPVLPVRRHGRRAPRPALRRLAGRRVRRRGGLRLRAVPGGGVARRASGRARVSPGAARAVGGRGRAGGLARERPRGRRRAPRARHDGAPLRVLRRARACRSTRWRASGFPRGDGSSWPSAPAPGWPRAPSPSPSPTGRSAPSRARAGRTRCPCASRSARWSRSSRSRSGRRWRPGSSPPAS